MSSNDSTAGIQAEKRESREFWAVTDSDVVKVTGYSCAPENPEYWWCPSVGYSLSTKHHLFKTERKALMKAIKETQNELHRIQKLSTD